MNKKIAIAIPCRNELLCCRTVKQFFASAIHPEDIEIWIVLDGWDFKRDDKFKAAYEAVFKMAENDSCIHIIEHDKSLGVRVAANRVAAQTQASYIMKIDSHCELSVGWDVQLINTYDEYELETLIIPEMRSLDPDTFKLGNRFFGACSIDPNIHQHYWMDFPARKGSKLEYEIMSNIGATWFTSVQYWWQLFLHDEVMFGSWGESAPETSLKCWLSGGRMILTTNVWFAHMFRRRFPYKISTTMIQENKRKTCSYWWGNEYPNQIHTIEWLVGKFGPVPGWESGTLYHRNLQNKKGIQNG